MKIDRRFDGSYFAGEHSRFHVKLFETRFKSKVWMVHDASWVTDADHRAGHSSPVVAQFNELDAAFTWCEDVELRDLSPLPHSSAYVGWPSLKERVAIHLAR